MHKLLQIFMNSNLEKSTLEWFGENIFDDNLYFLYGIILPFIVRFKEVYSVPHYQIPSIFNIEQLNSK